MHRRYALPALVSLKFVSRGGCVTRLARPLAWKKETDASFCNLACPVHAIVHWISTNIKHTCNYNRNRNGGNGMPHCAVSPDPDVLFTKFCSESAHQVGEGTSTLIITHILENVVHEGFLETEKRTMFRSLIQFDSVERLQVFPNH